MRPPREQPPSFEWRLQINIEVGAVDAGSLIACTREASPCLLCGCWQHGSGEFCRDCLTWSEHRANPRPLGTWSARRARER